MEMVEQVTKYCEKEEKLLLRSNFSSFPHYFLLGAISPLFHIILYIFLTSGVKLHIHLLNVVVRFIVFLTSATLICPATDISKYFRECLGIRDNEIRLYFLLMSVFTLNIQTLYLCTVSILKFEYVPFTIS